MRPCALLLHDALAWKQPCVVRRVLALAATKLFCREEPVGLGEGHQMIRLIDNVSEVQPTPNQTN